MRLSVAGVVALLAMAAAPRADDLKLGEVVPDIAFEAYDWKEYKFGAKQVNATFVLDKTGKLIYRGGLAVMKGTKKATQETVVEAVKAAKEGTEAPESDRRFAG
ncbi:MAG: hypothetical protein HY716_08440 [Planctomycetes bacterium]|nr:hypothetical protein [Planctomycetota bacterium]